MEGEEILVDVECNVIETSKLGNRGVMDLKNMNGHENSYPKYHKVEMTKANYISVNIRKSSDKSHVQIEGKPYIVMLKYFELSLQSSSVCSNI